MDGYSTALALLEEATRLMEAAGDTLIAAHIATPICLIRHHLDDPAQAQAAMHGWAELADDASRQRA